MLRSITSLPCKCYINSRCKVVKLICPFLLEFASCSAPPLCERLRLLSGELPTPHTRSSQFFRVFASPLAHYCSSVCHSTDSVQVLFGCSASDPTFLWLFVSVFLYFCIYVCITLFLYVCISFFRYAFSY